MPRPDLRVPKPLFSWEMRIYVNESNKKFWQFKIPIRYYDKFDAKTLDRLSAFTYSFLIVSPYAILYVDNHDINTFLNILMEISQEMK